MKIFLFEHGEHLAEVDLPAVPRIGENVVYGPRGKAHREFVVSEIVWDATEFGPAIRVHLEATK